MAQMIFSPRAGNDSFLTRLNPLTKLTGLIFFSFALTSDCLPLSLTAMALTVMTALAAGVPFMGYMRSAPALPVLAVFILITERAVSHSWLSASLEAARFMSLILASAVMLDSTDPSDLASSLGRLLAPVFGRYAWRFSSYVMLTLSLLPVIFSSSGEMMDARRSRLGSFLRHPVRNTGDYMLGLMLSLIRSAETYSDALESRLYDGDAERLSPEVHPRDILLIAILAGGIVWTNLL